MCVCAECGLSGESCLCGDGDKCCSCEFYDYIDGCIMPPEEECQKDLR